MKNLFNKFKAGLILNNYIWDDELIAFLVNNKKEGLTFKTLFLVNGQHEADLLAEKLEWMAKRLREGNYNNKFNK